MSLSQALAEIGKWGNLMRALGKVQETADTVAAQVQLTGEREKALAKLKADIEAAAITLQKLVDDARNTRDATEAAAKQVVADAHAWAADHVAKAKDAADALAKEAEAAKAAADDARSARAAAHSELGTARAELDAVLQRIESAKADALRRFGG
jgi:chromosome segregation ATPase